MGLLDAQQSEQQPAQQQPKGKDEETYRRLGLAAMKVIYSKPESDHVLAILEDGKDQPENAVAQAVLAVIRRIQNDMQGIDKKLAFAIAPALIMLIFELGFKAEIFTDEMFGDSDPQETIGEVLAILAQLTKEQPQEMPQTVPQGMPQGQPQQMGV